MKRSSLLIMVALLTMAGGVAVLYSSVWRPSVPEREPVRVVDVKRGSLSTHVAETATLEPVRTLDIKSQFSGEVREILVKEGQDVEPGQLLARIRQEPSQARQVAQLRAALEQEGLNVAQARRNLVRSQELFEKGFVSRNDWEVAQQQANQAMVRRELAERELLLALGGSRELFQRYVTGPSSSTRLEEFTVLSPSKGTIIEIKVQPGEIITSGTATVGGGTVLMRLADLKKMVAIAKVNEVNIARVQVGQTVAIRLDALPEQTFEGRVIAISPQGIKEEGIVTYEVTIEVENKGLSLRPMMTANVDIATETLEGVITIPLEALQSEHGDDIVYLEENGSRVRRKVDVALRTESVAVVGEGLREGDRVIIPSVQPASTSR